MQSYQGRIGRGKNAYVRYPKLTYSTIQQGLMKVLVEKRIGRNGWAVITALSMAVLADGRFGRKSSENMQAITGLTAAQVARGMLELKQASIIEPVERTNREGFRNPDRSTLNHVAQYRFTKSAWKSIEKIEPEGKND